MVSKTTSDFKSQTSEEDIKAKVIIPFLESCGFGKEELFFEKSFSIRLGRQERTIKGKIMGGRLDILVKCNGKNLFIIETKNDSSLLNDDDRDQAISYARLIDPIAPFTIVSNGCDTKIYETLTKEAVEGKKDYMLNYEPGELIEDLYREAFHYLIGYSEENLKIFCEGQKKNGMSALVGSRTQRNRKFISELFVSRVSLRSVLNEFLKSEKSVLAIVGDSGSGKTCEMCGIANSYNFPLLFYRGVELGSSLVKTIAEDFNWVFSQSLSEVALLKKLNSVVKNSLLILIDGIDEWESSEKIQELGRFADKINERKNIKIVISSKSYPWNDFEAKDGIETKLALNCFKHDGKNYFKLPRFSPEEFHKVLDKYRKFYSFNGLFQSEVLEECKRSLFFLRIAFEVAQKSEEVHLKYTNKGFFEEYLQKIFAKFDQGEREMALAQVFAIAEVIADCREEVVPMKIIRKKLGISLAEKLFQGLFEANILEAIFLGAEKHVTFYFQRIRDYILAFKVYDLENCPEKKLKDLHFSSLYNPILKQTMPLFYQLASDSRKRILDGKIYSKALEYVAFYEEVLNEVFPEIKERFEPKTNGKIGFVGEFKLEEVRMGMHGFKKVGSDEKLVELIPFDSFRSRRESNQTFLAGADRLHGFSSSNGFQDISVKEEVILHEVLPQIIKMIEDGGLDEKDCYYLSLEKVLSCAKKLGFLNCATTLERKLPITVDSILEQMRYKNAYDQISNDLTEQKRKSGEIQEKWDGRYRYSSTKFTEEEVVLISRKALEMAQNFDVDIPVSRFLNIKEIEIHLRQGLKELKKKSLEIEEIVVPFPDFQNNLIYGGFRPETLRTFLKRLYEIFLKEYPILVKNNFPQYQNDFYLFSAMPLRVVITTENEVLRPFCRVYFCKEENIRESKVITCSPKELTFDSKNKKLFVKERELSIISEQGFDLSYFLISNSAEDFLWLYPFCSLRSLIYRRIRNEFSAVEKSLKEKYCQW